jgi:hypothetical protein
MVPQLQFLSASKNSLRNFILKTFLSKNSLHYFYLRTAGRYRIQSTSLDAMWVVSEELVRRLEGRLGSGDESGPSITYTEPLPLGDFFQCIDDHFEVIFRISALRSMYGVVGFTKIFLIFGCLFIRNSVVKSY